jgi:hypothetical protein
MESQKEKESVRIDQLVAFYDMLDSSGYILGSPKKYGTPPTRRGALWLLLKQMADYF